MKNKLPVYTWRIRALNFNNVVEVFFPETFEYCSNILFVQLKSTLWTQVCTESYFIWPCDLEIFLWLCAGDHRGKRHYIFVLNNLSPHCCEHDFFVCIFVCLTMQQYNTISLVFPQHIGKTFGQVKMCEKSATSAGSQWNVAGSMFSKISGSVTCGVGRTINCNVSNSEKSVYIVI